MTPTLDLFVAGVPAPKGSKRALGPGRMIESSSKRLGPWLEVVALTAQAARPVCLDGPVRVDLTFVLRRPRRTKYADAPWGTPDLDKLTRAVGDALTGIAWVDDAQIVASTQVKRWTESGEKSGVRVVVSAWTPPT